MYHELRLADVAISVFVDYGVQLSLLSKVWKHHLYCPDELDEFIQRMRSPTRNRESATASAIR